MITERRYPDSSHSLCSMVAEHLRGSKSVVVQAGHFLLYQQERSGPAVPCVANIETDGAHGWIYDELGRFPDLSWDLALHCISSIAPKQAYILVLVNDWQYVLEAKARAEFYAEKPQLPESYIRSASVLADGIRLLTPEGSFSDFSSSSPFFSEQALRSKFKRRVRQLIDRNEMPLDIELADTDGITSCNLIDALGQKQEIYCSTKQADCAAEMAQLIADAHELVACDTLVNFYPRVCKQFVEFGSEIAPRIFGTGIKKIVNIALPANRVSIENDLFEGAEVVMHEF